MKSGFALLGIALVLESAPAWAAEVTVMSAGAVKSAFTEAAAAWEKQTGNKVNAATWAPAGDLRKKIAAGERADILVIPVEHFEALQREGAIDATTRHDLAGVSMGAAVKKGAPVPDISTAEKLKETLLSAKSLTYMDPQVGTSGKHFDETVLPKLGVRDAVRAKAELGKGGYIAERVASGDVEIAFHNVTEILPVAGVTFIGLIPAEFQKATIYSGVVMKGARNPKEAQAFLDYLVAPEGRKYFLDRGYNAP
jgi:molybdate transport system substrate-binding protein